MVQHHPRSRYVAGIACAVLVATTLAEAPPATASDDSTRSAAKAASSRGSGLALTPPMGWNDWNSFGCDVDAELVEQTADYLVTSGLKDAGYQYVNIDDCWMADERDPETGKLVPDPEKFPDGIRAVADYVHAKGLKLGIYESAGKTTCQGFPGSLGHETLDAQTFASWRVDYLKYDNCGANDTEQSQEAYQERYTTMADALEATNRDFVYSICEWGNYEVWKWGDEAGGELWRTTFDISDTFSSVVDIAEQNAPLAQYAGPGSWNDPDMLEVGNGGMTTTEYRSHFSLWAVMAAPLIIGTDLREISDADLAILENQDVIDVDQDSLGTQGELLYDTRSSMAFAKPLADGDVAVLLFNKSDSTKTLSTTASEAGIHAAGGRYTLRNLWSKKETVTTGRIRASVPAHGVAFYRVSRGAVRGTAPAAPVQVTANPTSVSGRGTTKVRVVVHNDSPRALTSLRASLRTLPTGWTATRLTRARKTVPPGGSAASTFRVRAGAPSAAISKVTLAGRAVFRARGVTLTRSSNTQVHQVAPVTGWATTDQTGGGALFGARNGEIDVLAAGDGVQAASTSPFGSTEAADEYGAVYADGGLADGGMVTGTVVAPQSLSSSNAVGLMARNDMTAAGTSPVGVALTVSGQPFGGGFQVSLVSSATGGTSYDTSVTSRASGSLPVQLRLTRDGATYTGSYSTDGGDTWTTVGTATLTVDAAAAMQDAGFVVSSGSGGVPITGGVTDLTVD